MGKIITVSLPDIGEGVVEGEVVQWLKNIGDPLKQDEPVVLVMTDKATVELPAPFPGKLANQHRKQGEIAQKDHPLYDIELASEEKREDEKKLPEAPVIKIPTAVSPQKSSFNSKSGEALAVPAVRHLAKEVGIDINLVEGTGKDGRVTAEDLKRIQGTQEANEPSTVFSQVDDEDVLLSGIPFLMVKKMAESKKQIPHFSYFEQADASRLVQLRLNFKHEGNKRGIQVTFMPFLIRALSLTLGKFPRLNSSLELVNKTLHIHHHHHIGIAMSTELGLIVPVLKNVETMDLNTLIYAYEELKEKAYQKRLQSEDMKGGTFTISNFGVPGGGGQWATPIINYPEAGILAISRIEKEPLVKNEEVAVRDVLHLSWSFDHRIIDGDLAAVASHHLASLIANPAALL